MVVYKVEVFTGDMMCAGTTNSITIQLIGTKGESDKIVVRRSLYLFPQKDEFEVPTTSSLGHLVLLRLQTKHHIFHFIDKEWFCSKVVVTTPEGETVHFPCYQWVSSDKPVVLRDAVATLPFNDTNPDAVKNRKEELELRSKAYRWSKFLDGLPESVKTKSVFSLPREVQFSFTKATEFFLTIEMKKTPFIMILFYNFPVTETMVKASLQEQRSLAEEIQNGNMFLVDYKNLDGVTANVINGKQQYLTAPLVLLHKNTDDTLKPIAIQLKQTPGDDNPIFLPTDSEYDWLLAKIFVRAADFAEHELNFHLLRTHLLSEVFAMATLRNFPMVHPLYKLLMPHFRYTLQIDTLARSQLISKHGIINTFAAVGGPGMMMYLKKAVASLTYSSLCMPEDIAARGLESLPNFYYRDDGLKLWNIIQKYVQGVVENYYCQDADVVKDSELQGWITEVYDHGFNKEPNTGIPQSFTLVTDLVKFLTMVIFTASVQHAAVNNGQFDFAGWMPNAPISLQKPPPTTKGQSTEKTMLETFPDINVTVHGLATVYLLSKQSDDYVPLGKYTDDQFIEKIPLEKIKQLQKELNIFNYETKIRNVELPLPYTYLMPEHVENSVAT
uniref:Lipoxygenase domain-containing protein n=1 Tax=Esox lucius TaxID=8010 RepID=A0AAY5K914_ESOLU